MSEPAAQLLQTDFAAPPPERHRASQRIVFGAAVFFIAQLTAIYFLGTKKPTNHRVVKNVPQFTLAASGDQLIALTDPTLFALPHMNDFSAKMWTKIPTANPPDFHWPEPPSWLELDAKNLGAALKDYLQTNAAAETPLNFKAELQTDAPEVELENFLEKNSALELKGALAQRKLLNDVNVPNLLLNDVIGPSRLQVLVAADGTVVSAVLLGSSGNAEADQTALRLARTARFAAEEPLMFGEMIFKWHTETANPNPPAAK